MRSLLIYGIPVTFGIRTCVAVHHRGGRHVKERAKFIMSRWNWSAAVFCSAAL